MKTFLAAIDLLTPAERRRALVLLLLVIAMAMLDVIGMASVMPFLAVMANPDMVTENRVLGDVYERLGFSSTDRFLFFLGAASFTLLVLAAVVRIVGHYTVNRYTQMRTHSIGVRLLDTYLRRPYAFYLNRHTGDLAKGLLSEVNQLVSQVYQPLSQVIAQTITLAALLSLLFVVDPMVALIMIGVLGGSYSLVYLTIRTYLGRVGLERVKANRARFQVVSEALGGIKPLKLTGRERTYIDRFSAASSTMARHQSMNATLSLAPKFVIEAIAFGGIILLTLALMAHYGGHEAGALGKVLPLLGLYAFVGYRMLPAVQAIYGAMTQLRFGAAALESIHADFEGRDALPALPRREVEHLSAREKVELRDITFTYDGDKGAGVKGVDIDIVIGSTLGIVGSTGAGKTTLVDVMLGLLRPQAGGIIVDGVPVTDANLREWQATLGYVPQDIFLVDASVSENIALGVPPAGIDQDRVRDCARMAQILEFIEGELPEGFETSVGERGVRLSGGQRQRIGIARALYNDPAIIIFDEATSALDNLTEQEVMRAVAALSGQKTVIMIAHRMSTVRNCDRIAVLHKGKLAAIGDYDTLYRDNAAFRRLVDARDAA
ncbi:MAG: ABC transporter ATP-binding protein [Caulobacter sp.]|nr:ABC transporter ATP-binding protein [Caulobacter sp.]